MKQTGRRHSLGGSDSNPCNTANQTPEQRHNVRRNEARQRGFGRDCNRFEILGDVSFLGSSDDCFSFRCLLSGDLNSKVFEIVPLERELSEDKRKLPVKFSEDGFEAGAKRSST